MRKWAGFRLMFYLVDGEWSNRSLQEVRSVVVFVPDLHQDPELTLRTQFVHS